MIARLFLSADIETRREGIINILNSHSTDGIINHKKGQIKHPDLLYVKEGDKLGIAEARKITDHFSLKPHSAKGRIAIIEEANNLTQEAQNALLKTLEDLPQEAILILGASTDVNLLPTLLSRCQITSMQTRPPKISSEFIKDLEKLLTEDYEERFAYVEKTKNKEDLLQLLVLAFREMLYTPHKLIPKEDIIKFLEELIQAEQWAKQNVNIRAILEYLMLVMPIGPKEIQLQKMSK